MFQKFFVVFLISFLTFSSFIMGWLAALYVLPEGTVQKTLSQEEEGKLNSQGEGKLSSHLVKETMNSLSILFDPYKIHSSIKKDTNLGSKEGPYGGKQDFLKPEKERKKLEIVRSLDKMEPATKEEKLEIPIANELSSQTETVQVLKKERATKEGKFEMPTETKPSSQNEAAQALKKLKDKYNKKNREGFYQMDNDQNLFTAKGKYGFLVNVFSNEKEASEYVEKMKETYPFWSFLVKIYKDHLRIYLGPFLTKQKAREFEKTLPQVDLFPTRILEEVSL